MKSTSRLVLVWLLVALTACAAPGTAVPGVPAAATTAAPAVAATETPLPPTPVPTGTPTPAPTATSTDTTTPDPALAAALATALAPTVVPTPAGGPGIEGISVAPLSPDGVSLPAGSAGLWAAWSYGLRSFEKDQKHFLAVYTRDAKSAWRQLARFELTTADYLDAQGALEQAHIAPGSVWLEVRSGAGAHGGCFDLLRFDGQSLTQPVEQCTPTPGGGASDVTDVNGDGTPDVVLDDTDPYVFCYACGVRLYQWHVLQWNGKDFVDVRLAPVPDTVEADVRDPLNRAVMLAGGGLWKDAEALAGQAEALNPLDPVAVWDIALIKLTAESRADPGPFPLLGRVFYGDYAAALDVLRPYQAAELFTVPSPLTADPMFSGWETDLSRWITTTATSAIAVEPDLAAAYFLRGWAEYQSNPQNPGAPADIMKAAQLDPKEPLYAQAVAYLKP